MSSFRALLPLVLVALAGACRTEPGAPSELFGPDARSVLAAPTELEVLALDPVAPGPDAPASGERLHGYAVLGQARVTDAAERALVVGLVSRGIDDSDGTVAACFDPRHGVRARRGDDVVELVICFECLQLDVYGPGDRQAGLTTTADPEPALSALFRRHGLDVHP